MLGLRYTVNEARYIFRYVESKQNNIYMQPHSIARARVKHARARYTTMTLYDKMIKIIIFKYIIITKCYKKVAACIVPPQVRAQPMLFCKLYFTKMRNFTFFLIAIMYISKKCIIFAADLKTTQNYNKIFI